MLKPHSSESVQLPEVVVVEGQGQRMLEPDLRFWTPSTACMQGTKRAPILIRT